MSSLTMMIFPLAGKRRSESAPLQEPGHVASNIIAVLVPENVGSRPKTDTDPATGSPLIPDPDETLFTIDPVASPSKSIVTVDDAGMGVGVMVCVGVGVNVDVAVTSGVGVGFGSRVKVTTRTAPPFCARTSANTV
jgi:hypothetical protein